MRWLAIGLAVVAGVMLWQHLRYLRARRNIVQDRQPMLYSTDSFHVITFPRSRSAALSMVEAMVSGCDG